MFHVTKNRSKFVQTGSHFLEASTTCYLLMSYTQADLRGDVYYSAVFMSGKRIVCREVFRELWLLFFMYGANEDFLRARDS